MAVFIDDNFSCGQREAGVMCDTSQYLTWALIPQCRRQRLRLFQSNSVLKKTTKKQNRLLILICSSCEHYSVHVMVPAPKFNPAISDRVTTDMSNS